MTWSNAEQQRLLQERAILAHYFPTLSWYNPTIRGSTGVQGTIATNTGRLYGIRVMLSASYPNDCPQMIVVSPHVLYDVSGRPMTSSSSSMHTWDAVDGHTKICHFNPRYWVPTNTVYLVAMKGRIWLEAYEAHLRTGRPLDDFLPHMAA
jgi:hypothetical protein